MFVTDFNVTLCISCAWLRENIECIRQMKLIIDMTMTGMSFLTMDCGLYQWILLVMETISGNKKEVTSKFTISYFALYEYLAGWTYLSHMLKCSSMIYNSYSSTSISIDNVTSHSQTCITREDLCSHARSSTRSHTHHSDRCPACRYNYIMLKLSTTKIYCLYKHLFNEHFFIKPFSHHHVAIAHWFSAWYRVYIYLATLQKHVILLQILQLSNAYNYTNIAFVM